MNVLGDPKDRFLARALLAAALLAGLFALLLLPAAPPVVGSGESISISGPTAPVVKGADFTVTMTVADLSSGYSYLIELEASDELAFNSVDDGCDSSSRTITVTQSSHTATVYACAAGTGTIEVDLVVITDKQLTTVSEAELTVVVTTLTDPPAPTGLTTTEIGQNNIKLDWDSTAGVSKYRVVYGTTTLETTRSDYNVTGLTPATSYTFNVSAYGNGMTYLADWGSASTIVKSTLALPLPPAPTGLQATAGTTNIRLDWGGSTAGVSKYRVVYGTTTLETTRSDYNVTGLTPATSYTFNVSAYGNGTTLRADWGSASTIVKSTLALPLPPAPAGLQVTETSQTNIKLDWGSTAGVSKYRVSYGTTTRETTSSEYNVTNLITDTSYTFSVSAYGNGVTYRADWGSASTITKSTLAAESIAVTGSASTVVEGQSITVTVEASNLYSGGGYFIDMTAANGLRFDAECGVTAMEIRVPPGATSHTADLTVYACAEGEGSVTAALSEVIVKRIVLVATGVLNVTIIALPLPPAPTGLQATAGTTNIRLDWGGSTAGVSKYRVVYGTTTLETTRSDYNVTGLTPATSYTFNVSAYGNGTTLRADWGSASTIVKSTLALPLPPAPAGLQVTETSQTNIKLDWGSTAGVSKYRVSYGTTTRETTSSEYNVTNLITDTSYTFSVSAYGNGVTYRADWGSASTITKSTLAAESIAVTGSASTVVEGQSITVTVEASNLYSGGGYFIDMTAANGLRFDAECGVTAMEIRVPPGATSHTADLTVYACAEGEGSVTAALSEVIVKRIVLVATGVLNVTIIALPLPPAPTGLQATAGTTNIRLDWGGSTAGVSKYRVVYGTTTLETTRSDYNVTGLTPATSYTFNVSAYGNGTTLRADWGSASTIVKSTLALPLPPAPAGLQATAGTTNIRLDWGGSTAGVSKYRVVYGTTTLETTRSDYNVTGLTPATSYTFSVSAYGDGVTYLADWGSASTIVKSTSVLPLPPAPAGLEVTETGQTNIKLDWDSTAGVSKYRVQYGTTTRETTSSEYNVTNLITDTSYTFSVSAYGNGMTYRAAWGSASTITKSTLAAESIAVTGSASTVVEGQSVTVTVEASNLYSGGDYFIDMTAANGLRFDAECGVTTMEIRVPPGAASHTADLTVYACAEGEGSVTAALSEVIVKRIVLVATGVLNVTITPSLPPAPEQLRATESTHDTVKLVWNPRTGAAHYQVRHGESDSGPWTESENVLGTTYTVGNLEGKTTYYFQVRAWGDGSTHTAGWGDYSTPPLQTTTPVAPPGPVQDLTVTAGQASLELGWIVPLYDGGAAITRYEVQHKEKKPTVPWPSGAGVDNGTSITRTIIGLQNGTWYDVRVRACNTAVPEPCGAWSEASGKPRTKPDQMAAPTVTPGDMKLEVSWSEPFDGGEAIVDYEVQYKKTSEPDSSFAVVNHGTAESATITGLENGTPYDVEVRACNYVIPTVPCGFWSGTTTATPQAQLAAPANLDVTPLPLRMARLSWTGVTNATEYKVEVRKAGGMWQPPNNGVGGIILSDGTTNLSNGVQSATVYEIDLKIILNASATVKDTHGLADAPAYEFQVKAMSTPAYAESEYSKVRIIDTPIIRVNGYSSGAPAAGRQSSGNRSRMPQAILFDGESWGLT